MADRRHVLHGRARIGAVDADALRGAVLRLAARLPAPTEGSHIAFAFDRDLAAAAVALLACWQRGHAAALPASARRRHLGPVLARPEVVALLHDTGAGTGIDVARLLAEPAVGAVDHSALALVGPVTAFAPDGSVVTLAAATVAARLDQALAELALRPGRNVAHLCPPALPDALVPGLLAPLAAGAAVRAEAVGADVVVAPRAAAAALPGRAARVVAIDLPVDPPVEVPRRRALPFAAVAAAAGEHARFRTTVPPDHFGFAGHFRGYPVLSGAVQLHELVLPCLHAAFGPVAVGAFQDLKFLARIGPGDTVDVALRTVAADRCEFTIARGDTKCSTGRAVFGTTGTASP
ncbi:MAG: hypothetical protein JNL08_21705 [Planctomycetes bacterium]|nr:hypothetical protein [Planctomycetota bacterium]